MTPADSTPRRLLGPTLLVAVTLSPGVSLAGAPARDPVAAEAQFRAGREAFKVGDFATACPRFAESYRLDPAPGALFNLADCEEQADKTASAWQRWQELVDLLRGTPSDPRFAIAQQHVAALGAKLPKLLLRWKETPPAGAVVKRDGVVLGSASIGVPLPVDPGPHVIEVTAKGRRASTVQVLSRNGEKLEVALKAGEPLVVAEPEPPAVAEPEPPRPRRDLVQPGPAPRDQGGGTSPLVIAGAIGIGLGGALLITGAASGAAALSSKNTVVNQCEDLTKVCVQSGADAAASGHTWATVSTATLIAGGVLAATGVVLVVVGKTRGNRHASVAPLLGPGQAGVVVGGTF